MLVPLTGAFLSGLVLGSYVPYLPVVILLLLAVALLTLALLEYRGYLRSSHSTLLYAAVLLGVCFWSARVPPSLNSSQHPDLQPREVHGTVIQPVHHGPERLIMVIRADPQNPGDRAATVRVTWRSPNREVLHGNRVGFMARVHAPSSTMNPGGFDYQAYLERAGIDLVASISGPDAVEVSEGEVWNPWSVIDRWRSHIRRAATRSLSMPALGVYLGMIIGEPGYIAPHVRDDFMATGTIHILSISGSHLGLIAILCFFAVKKLCRALPTLWLLSLSRHITATQLAAIVTLVPVGFYTVLAGAEIATVRSFIMIALFLLTVWLGREQDVLLTLSLAAVLIAMHEPAAVFDISFQLSFVSVLAIALALRWRASPKQATRPHLSAPVQQWFRDYIRIGGGITLMTLPLAAYYFNQMAWLGLVSNLAVVPWAGFVLVPLGLACAIATLLTGSDVLVGAALNQSLLDLFCATMAWLATVPGARWHVASPTLLTMVIFYALLAVACRPGRRRLVRALATIGVIAIVGWWSWSPHRLRADELRVTFLDVGQGDAAVLELPGGITILIDGGAAYDTLDMGRAVVAPYLWDRGIRRLDHIIATHPQLDHVGGLTSIVQQFEVGEYWDNGIRRDEAFYRRLDEALMAHRVPRHVATAGQIIAAQGICRLIVLNPPPGTVHGTLEKAGLQALGGTMLNNLSVVARLDCGRHSFLLTGDIEAEAISRLKRKRDLFMGDVVKVPHHGARSSLDTDWIQTQPPRAAVISVGRHNAYRHPAPAVLEAYGLSGLPLYRTDIHGAIWFTATENAGTFEVHRARDVRPQPLLLTHYAWRLERHNAFRLMQEWGGLF